MLGSCLPVGGHCCLQVLVILKNTAIRVCVQVFAWPCVFDSHGWIPRSGTAGSCAECMFALLRNCPTVSQLLCRLRFHQPRVAPTSPAVLCIVWYLKHYSHLSGVWWYLITVLTRTSRMANNAECLSTCLFVIDISVTFGDMSIKSLLILNLNCLLIIALQEFFVYSGSKFCIRYAIGKYFLPACGLSSFS